MSLADSRVIPKMLTSMIAGAQVVIFGDGTNTRSFLNVEDLLEGFELAMAEARSGELFNIGGEQEITINKLFEICRKITGYSLPPLYLPHFIEDHKRRLPDTEKIRALGWRQHISISEGLRSSYFDVKRRLADPTFYKPNTRIQGASLKEIYSTVLANTSS